MSTDINLLNIGMLAIALTANFLFIVFAIKSEKVLKKVEQLNYDIYQNNILYIENEYNKLQSNILYINEKWIHDERITDKTFLFCLYRWNISKYINFEYIKNKYGGEYE